MSPQWIRSGAVVAAVVVLVGAVAAFRLGRPAPPGPAGGAVPRMLDLGSDKCTACREMAPILTELRSQLAGRAVIEFIDVWKDPAAAEPYGARIIPTQVFFDRDGREVWRHEGFLSKQEIVEKLKELGAR